MIQPHHDPFSPCKRRCNTFITCTHLPRNLDDRGLLSVGNDIHLFPDTICPFIAQIRVLSTNFELIYSFRLSLVGRLLPLVSHLWSIHCSVPILLLGTVTTWHCTLRTVETRRLLSTLLENHSPSLGACLFRYSSSFLSGGHISKRQRVSDVSSHHVGHPAGIW